MTILGELAALLRFRSRALRALSARGNVVVGAISFCIAYLVFVLVRNSVYLGIEEPFIPTGPLQSILQINLLQMLLYLSVVYVPTVIVLGNAISRDGAGLSASREEYRAHLAALFPLWAILFLISAPLQLVFPQFLILGIVEISMGLLALILLLLVYTVWAIKELSYLSLPAALGVFILSWLTLPVFYLLTAFLLALPFFLLIPLFYVVLQRVRAFESRRVSERNLQQQLQILTVNPRDADAHYQLGLIHFKRGNLNAAQRYFESALKIAGNDADYHYFLGRVFEAGEDWPKALEQDEETYRLNSQHAQGDIFREVGKGYLHTSSVDKAIEFLGFFLKDRTSDPEGRYWLAVAHQRLGNVEEMRSQLKTLLEQARSSPRFFRKENRKWIYRGRILLRQ